MFNVRIHAEHFDPDMVPEGAITIATVWVDDLLLFVDPLREPPWKGIRRAITADDVREFVSRNAMVQEVVDIGTWRGDIESGLTEEECDHIAWNDHVGRIAWLAMNPDPDPITVDVGMHRESEPYVLDGHHRIAAALVRQIWGGYAEQIDLTFDGSYEAFLSLFPRAVLEVLPGESMVDAYRPRPCGPAL